ncbi:MAG TPA: hypothetical protein VHK88_09030 [Aquihabitans sp.]|jgi:hypothetical protein|nr:hypothetical protein [Aquihabitans sp.]
MAGKRRKGGPPSSTTPTGTSGAPVDPNLALFASYVRGEEQRERDAKRAAREARQQAETLAELQAAKDAAAAEVKRLRSREGVSPEQRAAADAAYREALAAVVAAETGEAPAWAPPPPEPETEAEAPPADDDAADPATDADAEAVARDDGSTEDDAAAG